jgi:hypothetical protein
MDEERLTAKNEKPPREIHLQFSSSLASLASLAVTLLGIRITLAANALVGINDMMMAALAPFLSSGNRSGHSRRCAAD